MLFTSTIVRQDCTSNLAGENNLLVVNIEEQCKEENGKNTKNNETESSKQIEVTEGIDENEESAEVDMTENSKTSNRVAEQAELNKIEKNIRQPILCMSNKMNNRSGTWFLYE
ncbi:hypothetical protein JTB14_026315 [Gonioctena quinquepunctata]|nr:hypothetical protein JTB14_026315 [Gonioctena quinquepunctata]